MSGAAALLPSLLWKPLLVARNHECLNRLAFLAEGRREKREAREPQHRKTDPDDLGEAGS